MVTIASLFAEEKSALLAALPPTCPVADAQEAALAGLLRVKRRYSEAEDDPGRRSTASALFDLAENALPMLSSADDAKVYIELPTSAPERTMGRQILRFLPLVLCGAAGVMLFYQNNTLASLLGGAAILGSAAQTFRRGERVGDTPLPQGRGEVRVNTHRLLNTLEHICVTMDAALGKTQSAPAGQGIAWEGNSLSALQMLWEALHTEDGAYALKAAPALLHGLEQQKVKILEYAPEYEEYFEKLPGEPVGITIRPALVSGENLLARGQVTA